MKCESTVREKFEGAMLAVPSESVMMQVAAVLGVERPRGLWSLRSSRHIFIRGIVEAAEYSIECVA